MSKKITETDIKLFLANTKNDKILHEAAQILEYLFKSVLELNQEIKNLKKELEELEKIKRKIRNMRA